MRIGLGYNQQQPFTEFVNGSWRVWVIYNPDVTSGTYLELYPDGTCDRVVVKDRDVHSIERISL